MQSVNTRKELIEPVVLALLTRRMDWQYPCIGYNIDSKVNLDDFLNDSSQRVMDWISQNETRIRRHLPETDINNDVLEMYHELLDAMGLTLATCVDFADSNGIILDYVRPYLLRLYY